MVWRMASVAGVLVSVILIAAGIRSDTPADGPVDPRVRFLCAGIASYRQYSGPLAVTLTVHNHSPGETTVWRYPERTELKDEERNVVVRWYRDHDNRAVIVTGTSPGAEELVEERLAETARETRTLQKYLRHQGAEERVDWRGVILAPGASHRDGLWVGHDWADPRLYAYYDKLKPLDQVLTQGPVVSVTEDRCNDSRCLRAQVGSGEKGYRTIYWLDRDHNLVIRRVAVYQRLGDRDVLTYEANVPALVGDKEAWFPAVFEARMYIRLLEEKVKNGLNRGQIPLSRILTARTTRKDGIITLPPVVARVTISHVATGVPIPPELFAPEWPLGTLVGDTTRQETYRVTAVPVKTGTERQPNGGSNPR